MSTSPQTALSTHPAVAAVVASVATPAALTVPQTATDGGRAARGAALTVKPLGASLPHLFKVSGGKQDHIVNLDPRTDTPCDCMDARVRRVVCKHQHAVGILLTGRAS